MSHVAEDATAPPLALLGASPLPAKLRGYWLHPLNHYAAIYGYDPASGGRTIKRFVSLGRNSTPPDLPPLDDPIAFAEWWRAHHPGRNLPPGIRRAITTVPAAPAAPLVENHPTPALDIPLDTELDFPAQVRALRASCQHDLRKLATLKAEPTPTGLDPEQLINWHRAQDQRITAANKQHSDSFDMLRKAETALQSWEKENNLLVYRDKVASEVTRIISAINSAGKRLIRKMRPLLEGKTPAEQDTLWETEWAKSFRMLADTRFVEEKFLAETFALDPAT